MKSILALVLVASSVTAVPTDPPTTHDVKVTSPAHGLYNVPAPFLLDESGDPLPGNEGVF